MRQFLKISFLLLFVLSLFLYLLFPDTTEFLILSMVFLSTSFLMQQIDETKEEIIKEIKNQKP